MVGERGGRIDVYEKEVIGRSSKQVINHKLQIIAKKTVLKQNKMEW